MNVEKQVESLINAAKVSGDAREAMMLSQAALNAAHAAQVVVETRHKASELVKESHD